MILFPLIFVLSALAEDQPNMRNLVEKTWPRDNTFCTFGNKKISIQVRGDSKLTDLNSPAYGEHLLFYPEQEKPEHLGLSKDLMHTYRLFLGESKICSKSHAYLVGKDRVAILFLRENSPFKDKLSLVLMNTKGDGVLESVTTEHMSNQAAFYPGGFIFNSYPEREEPELGQLKISGVDYTFQDREFVTWMSYTEKGIRPLGLMTFQKFPWKQLYKDEKDFFTAAGWDEANSTFSNQKIYLSVNHKLGKECVLLLPTRSKLDPAKVGGWRCYTKNAL